MHQEQQPNYKCGLKINKKRVYKDILSTQKEFLNPQIFQNNLGKRESLESKHKSFSLNKLLKLIL